MSGVVLERSVGDAIDHELHQSGPESSCRPAEKLAT